MVELESAQTSATAVPSCAALEAAGNWNRNISALAVTQPDFAALEIARDGQLLFARDGALTALLNGKWWGGCSVPEKAAGELLRTLNITSLVGCFLCPTHSAQIAFALERLNPQQAVVALFPRLGDLVLALQCQDFSADISSHRLWFAAGEEWPLQMSKLFEQNPGLPLPQQFIRTALLSEDASAPLIAAAQKIFSDELNRRSSLLADLRQIRSGSRQNRITLAANMQFRLWDDAGLVLREMLGDESLIVIDFDDPAQASPLALARAAAESDAIITANLTRADCGQFLHPQIPLVTWLTSRPIPCFDLTSRDMLLLADPRMIEAAKKTGWPANRLFPAPWPGIATSNSTGTIAIIADTRLIDLSPAFDLSSHQLLWNLIGTEIRENPSLINNDPAGYLHSRMQRLNISEQGLDRRLFLEGLIVPAYQQSIAAHLLDAGLPLQIFGRGWRDIPAFARRAAGEIASRNELKRAVASALALVHLWPTDHSHPIDRAGPAVIRLASRGVSGLVADARRAATGNLVKPPPPAADGFDMAAIARILRAAQA